ncbi:MAG: ABC transporter ATP-binding protein [Deltaproteobacteria bacterium]|nr:ABC transporter ATP-binding protein [Deltaproteobacteria bacterium]MCZ6450564.1 ABC transporter ATP-binding protein [Deltaproteobacteria bacterium]MCZ6549685.1 ABC transporter ATP-binding protein [Deltaproteobacteria bacterium]MCZ6906289.1 ABC transporter ATP-binding protein [Deltaproteobacteria bacterium]
MERLGVELHHISKSFEKDGSPVQVLDNLDVRNEAGEFVSFLGPSGCGKTTTLKIIGGLLEPDGGEVIIGNKRVTGPGPDRSIVFQDYALLPWVDVLRNVAFGLELRGVPKGEREEIARTYIQKVKLSGFEHHYPNELSGGMQQRVGLARALAVNPQILLMDEPFASVDEQTRRLFQSDLSDLWQEEQKTVIFITHSMEEAVYLSDRIFVMSARPGRIVEEFVVHLPRPRTAQDIRGSKEFTESVEHLWGVLRELQ